MGNKLCALVIEHFREITAEPIWSDKDDRKGMMQLIQEQTLCCQFGCSCWGAQP